uniref:Nuclease HARBI1 n=1 Tax=Cacopsylla melanoneura TaxID=428564 RepID=A0A8D8QLB9_9HEMI
MGDFDNFLEFLEYLEDDPYPRMERVVFRDQENPLEALTNVEFMKHYHISKESVRDVVLPLVRSDPVQNNRGLPIPDHLKLLTFVRYLSSGSFQLTCGELSKLSQGTVCNVVKEMSVKLVTHFPQFVNFPANNDMPAVHEKFYALKQFPGVSGCVDGTHIPIYSPGGENAEIYRCRKGFFSLNVQVVAGPDLQFFDVIARWPGSTHDSRMFDGSAAKARFQMGHVQGHLLGDAGYAQKPYLYTPLRNPVTRSELRYNNAHKTTRNVVERAIGVWKRKFPILNRKMQNNLPNAVNIILASAILHNITRAEHIPDDDDDANAIDLHLDVNINQPGIDNVNAASRNEFIDRHFH